MTNLITAYKGKIWLAAGLLWLLIIAVLSLAELPESGTGVNDKLSHLLAYLFLTCWFSLLTGNRLQVILLVMLLFAYGLIIEGLQSLTSYRTAELADLVANLSGIALAMPLYLLPWHQRLRNYFS